VEQQGTGITDLGRERDALIWRNNGIGSLSAKIISRFNGLV